MWSISSNLTIVLFLTYSLKLNKMSILSNSLQWNNIAKILLKCCRIPLKQFQRTAERQKSPKNFVVLSKTCEALPNYCQKTLIPRLSSWTNFVGQTWMQSCGRFRWTSPSGQNQLPSFRLFRRTDPLSCLDESISWATPTTIPWAELISCAKPNQKNQSRGPNSSPNKVKVSMYHHHHHLSPTNQPQTKSSQSSSLVTNKSNCKSNRHYLHSTKTNHHYHRSPTNQSTKLQTKLLSSLTNQTAN